MPVALASIRSQLLPRLLDEWEHLCFLPESVSRRDGSGSSGVSVSEATFDAHELLFVEATLSPTIAIHLVSRGRKLGKVTSDEARALAHNLIMAADMIDGQCP